MMRRPQVGSSDIYGNGVRHMLSSQRNAQQASAAAAAQYRNPAPLNYGVQGGYSGYKSSGFGGMPGSSTGGWQQQSATRRGVQSSPSMGMSGNCAYKNLRGECAVPNVLDEHGQMMAAHQYDSLWNRGIDPRRVNEERQRNLAYQNMSRRAFGQWW